MDKGELQRQIDWFEAQAEAAPQLRDYLNHHLPHYQELIAKKLNG